MDVGFWAIVPPLLTIGLAIVTKEVLLSLFIGVYAGSLIIVGWNPLSAMEKMVQIIITGLTDPGHMQVLIIVVMLGGLIGLLTRSGGSSAFGNLLGRKIKTRKGAEGTSWLIGLFIFFDDYFNVLANGTIMRSISDKFGVPREKLSYIFDSTAVGICLVVPLSSWVAFITSLISSSYASAGIKEDAFRTYLMCIPYNYYAWLCLIMVIVVACLGLNYGPMAKAERRTRETGALCDKTFSGGGSDDDDFSSIEQKNGGPIDLLAPILLLIMCTLVFMLYTGGFFKSHSVLDAVNNMDGMLSLTYAVSIAVIFAIIFYAIRKLSGVSDSISAFVVGTKSMLFVVILLAFAWGIGGVGDELDTAGFVASLFVGNVSPNMVAIILLVFSLAMTFATGATWGTYAIMIPMAVSIALAMDISVYMCVAAVLGGGGCGEHCSPLADTSILASASANVSLTDHIKTQAPYSLTCAVVACAGFFMLGITDNWFISTAVVIVLFLVCIFALNKIFGANKSQIKSSSGELSELEEVITENS